MVLLIHHLHVSQSERIPWLCEELGLEYELKTYKRTPILAPPEYKALHPMGAAPVIQDGDLTLAESCACIEYICHRYGNARLFLPSSDEAYADFLYWWHWVDGTFDPAIGRGVPSRSSRPDDNNNNTIGAKIGKERFNKALAMLNERFGNSLWLAGKEFTAADVMLVFLLTTMRYFFPYELGEYSHIVAYLERIGQRDAYKRAMARSDPGLELALGAHPPEVK
ncbi:glutathione S-transferase [Mariannaea sp. PMI_226]|nr:glutathione S-transferase [Mariannaea sp. PMI_226]